VRSNPDGNVKSRASCAARRGGSGHSATLQRQSIATVASLIKAAKLTVATVNKWLAYWERINVVGKLTNQPRGRVFGYGKQVEEWTAELASQ
jgi:hypothetical protein